MTASETTEVVLAAAVEFVNSSVGLHDVAEVRAEFTVAGIRYAVSAEDDL